MTAVLDNITSHLRNGRQHPPRAPFQLRRRELHGSKPCCNTYAGVGRYMVNETALRPPHHYGRAQRGCRRQYLLRTTQYMAPFGEGNRLFMIGGLSNWHNCKQNASGAAKDMLLRRQNILNLKIALTAHAIWHGALYRSWANFSRGCRPYSRRPGE